MRSDHADGTILADPNPLGVLAALAVDPDDGALYRSVDGAENWVRLTLPNGVNARNGLAIDPATPSRMYLAAWAAAYSLPRIAARTWRNTLDRDQHVYDVTIDPHDAKILYASGFESSVWRSRDRGESWTRVPGFDPLDLEFIYVTTFGGSVWHGPADAR